MIAKKREGEADEAEMDSVSDQAKPEESVPTDVQPRAAAPAKQDGPSKPDATAKTPEPPRKPEPAPRAEAKPQPAIRPQEKAKPKPEAQPEQTAKPGEMKSLAQVMKFDLKVRRRPRF